MAVSYTKIYQDATSYPSDSAGATFDVSNPMPAGLMEMFGIRLKGTTSAQPSAASTTSLIKNLRITINGDQWFSYTNLAASRTTAGLDRFSALVQDMGGFIAEKGSLTDQDVTIWLPAGLRLPGNSRFECHIEYVQSAGTWSNVKFELWSKYGQSSNATIVGNQTSATMVSGAQVQVTVKIPTYKGATVTGIQIQSTTAGDDLSEVIAKPLGDFAFTPTLARGLAGRAAGRDPYEYMDAGASLTSPQLSDGQGTGQIFLPLYSLANTDGSVTLLVTAGTSEIYTFTPLLALPTGGNGEAQPVQTASKATGSAESVLNRQMCESLTT